MKRGRVAIYPPKRRQQYICRPDQAFTRSHMQYPLTSNRFIPARTQPSLTKYHGAQQRPPTSSLPTKLHSCHQSSSLNNHLPSPPTLPSYPSPPSHRCPKTPAVLMETTLSITDFSGSSIGRPLHRTCHVLGLAALRARVDSYVLHRAGPERPRRVWPFFHLRGRGRGAGGGV